jgi:hypothetical protein
MNVSLERLTIVILALTVAPAILTFKAYGKDIEVTAQSSQIYDHTFDEVFQACQETFERDGLFIVDKSKDKGTLTAKSAGQTDKDDRYAFDVRVETVSNKPETRVTVIAHLVSPWHKLVGKSFYERLAQNSSQGFVVKLQKVLATYR